MDVTEETASRKLDIGVVLLRATAALLLLLAALIFYGLVFSPDPNEQAASERGEILEALPEPTAMQATPAQEEIQCGWWFGCEASPGSPRRDGRFWFEYRADSADLGAAETAVRNRLEDLGYEHRCTYEAIEWFSGASNRNPVSLITTEDSVSVGVTTTPDGPGKLGSPDYTVDLARTMRDCL